MLVGFGRFIVTQFPQVLTYCNCKRRKHQKLLITLEELSYNDITLPYKNCIQVNCTSLYVVDMAYLELVTFILYH